MFFTFGARTCIKNVILCNSDGFDASDSFSTIRSRYLQFCRNVGGESLIPSGNQDLWVNDEQRISQILKHFLILSDLTDLSVEISDTPSESRVKAGESVMAALSFLGSIDSDLKAIFELVIHTLFYHRSYEAGGGSVSSAPGVIWCSIRKDWNTQDIAEFLVHELAHNLLFIDERVNRHYKSLNLIMDKKTYAYSSILKTLRPLDKVFHSLMVALEVVALRQKIGEPSYPKAHPPTVEINRAISNTIDSIEALPLQDLVEPRFIEIFNEMKATYHDNIQWKHVA
jgi:hypothetical protein